ncbi:MAG: GH36-type glycosyl hydrolase domain-containing protein [Candidatus Sumerlaeaceae bacterium]
MSRLLLLNRPLSLPDSSSEEPLRQELFSTEQLCEHARVIAAQHQLDTHRYPDRLLVRLTENEKVLTYAYDQENRAAEKKRDLTATSEWLLDNYYLIEEQIRIARQHLPKGYSRQLPRLRNSTPPNVPRAYGIVLELISHVDGRVDGENLTVFVESYQSVTQLTLGELWAIPIMLRLALIENLRRVAARLAARRKHFELADHWVDRLIERAEIDPTTLIVTVAEMAQARLPMSGAFVGQFSKRMQDYSGAPSFAISWLEQQLVHEGSTVVELVRADMTQQAIEHISMNNSIGSLRTLEAIDWREFVDTLSIVEKTLRSDPADVYSDMDFFTRDACRHRVEDISRRSRQSEYAVAQLAVEISRAALASHGKRAPESHVGYYLLDNGIAALKQAANIRPGFRDFLDKCRRCTFGSYIYSLTLLSATVALMLLWLEFSGTQRAWLWLPVGILVLICASQLAATLVNWLAMQLVHPRALPRMDFSEGIPPDCKTLVAVPTLLTDIKSAQDLLDDLEVRYLANRDARLSFALLTDLPDAAAEIIESDAAVVQLVSEGIRELNDKYHVEQRDVYYLFHRPRLWNAQERVWMGYERKRGKLGDLNALLQGEARDRFSVIVGDTAQLQGVKFIITLDTDTRLPREAAQKLVATMAHPLNRPGYSTDGTRIVRGYSILQPRVAVSLPSSRRSWYVRLFGGDAGIDPYTRTVSDVYQDLFEEGSFIGKGIYDLEAFQRELDGQFPENLILSHDLLEGCYARSGLVTDVELFEDHPSRYSTDVARRSRWIRGDWQIARYVLPGCSRRQNAPESDYLSGLSRWKIFDNLRRSLVPASAFALLLVGWMLLNNPWPWTAFVVAIFLSPAILGLLAGGCNRSSELPWTLHLLECGKAFGRQVMQSVFTVAMLPYETYYSLDAIARTLHRLIVSKRHLLEWTTAKQAGRNSSAGLAAQWRQMWMSPAVASLVLVELFWSRPIVLIPAAPFLSLWLLSPVIAWWISLPLRERTTLRAPQQRAFLEKLARRTWRFFETFAGPDDHWLPVDNYQEYPVTTTAHRTSPTNMGMCLLSNLTAYDFGYITCGELVERTQRTLNSMQLLERFRGHFYNWYDTNTLKPLEPLYVSTVDSGNLAGHLLTLRQGLLALPEVGILPARHLSGLRDTLELFADSLQMKDSAKAPRPETLTRSVDMVITAIRAELAIDNRSLTDYIDLIQKLQLAGDELASRFAPDDDTEANYWSVAFSRQCRSALAELEELTPWLFLEQNGNHDEELHAHLDELNESGSLNAIASLATRFPGEASTLRYNSTSDNGGTATAVAVDTRLLQCVSEATQRAKLRIQLIEQMAAVCQELAELDYDFLYDTSRQLLTIGYNVTDRRRDASCYDLLASEARLCSFVAIAQNRLPLEHWFALGRQLTTSGAETALLSWSGSMFEYLMPLLVMPDYEGTLLHETYKAVVERQIEYGRERGVPWGISESGYNLTDARLDYQYRAFGVPGLGLKRGLSKDIVIAPYACVMALMIEPERACSNLQHMVELGYVGAYGMYEAIDYTSARLTRTQNAAIVRSFMAHHQGMSFLSLAYVLLDRPMQMRFMADPLFRATDLLLQERVPKAVPFYPHAMEVSSARVASTQPAESMRVITTPHTPHPEVRLLSNGRYTVMVTNSGSGQSLWNGLSLTRWREDPTRDNWGQFCYIRDVNADESWCAGYHPLMSLSKRYEAIFSPGRAEFRRWDSSIETHTDIMVSAEDDVELRRITVSNNSASSKLIELTTYAEVVLAAQPADETHPAFSNLFVQTELYRDRQAILCTRRPRAPGEQHPWMIHLLSISGTMAGSASYETDRMKFLGRGRTTANPVAMETDVLSGTEGPVLDPIVAIRCRVSIEPDENCVVDVVTGVADTRDGALALIEKYHDRRLTDRIAELSWTHEQLILRQLQASFSDLQAFEQLVSTMIYSHARRRASATILLKNSRTQAGLWGYGLSGDMPIMLVRIDDRDQLALVREAVQTYAYWRLMGYAADLVICNEDRSGYRQELQDEILAHVTAGGHPLDRPGGIFVRRSEQIPDEDFVLLQSAARVLLTGGNGSLAEQAARRFRVERGAPALLPITGPRREPTSDTQLDMRTDLIFDNGHGGFTSDGREYVIRTTKGQSTPAPWVNVLANPFFGTIVTESGGGYTWSENAHEYRLTPWSNDAVSDSPGEALYIRDEDSGLFWSPTPRPSPVGNGYLTRHGFGYTVFQHIHSGISTELWVYVATDASVKFLTLKLRNLSGRTRRLSLTGYVEWVLAEFRHRSLPHIATELDPKTGAVFARNAYHLDLPERIAFFDVSEFEKTFTSDRAEFIGRNGSLSSPDALKRQRLSGKRGAGMDACTAVQVKLELAESQERDVTFMLGAGRNTDDARQLVTRFRGNAPARQALQQVWDYWNRTLGAVYIETPDKSLDVLANGWLLYQTLACRMWGRSGFYQSGGAYGFRDQLQDSMALIHSQPAVMRAHLLHSAANQFSEGDVQHWWHPPLGRGVRTHCSDDLLWLPLAVCRYVNAIGDTGVLDESIPFLQAPPLRQEDESRYDLPHHGDDSGTLYEHCVRAIKRSLTSGAHGLPLMGGCDWNDGMNLVGHEGKGESVWLAFFLHTVLTGFGKIAGQRADQEFADQCNAEAESLRKRIEENAWDGNWYRRAYFDNGDPLGSASNQECRIDSISQSWSVLSGAGDPDRRESAMKSLSEHLVRDNDAIVLLLEPPFDTSPQEPGYIKGYVPGVRENGGQYTHAAIWAAMAFATMGNTGRAWELMALINPVMHGSTPESISTYRVEPYVVAADVYGRPPHTGRGGWTWYTGSAAWMYRLIIESLLGIHLRVDHLELNPSMPASWRFYAVNYRFHESTYRIEFLRTGDGNTVLQLKINGSEVPGNRVPLINDRQRHDVQVQLG